jgi:hypothetical protein
MTSETVAGSPVVSFKMGEAPPFGARLDQFDSAVGANGNGELMVHLPFAGPKASGFVGGVELSASSAAGVQERV